MISSNDQLVVKAITISVVEGVSLVTDTMSNVLQTCLSMTFNVTVRKYMLILMTYMKITNFFTHFGRYGFLVGETLASHFSALGFE